MNKPSGEVNFSDQPDFPLVSILIPSYKSHWFQEALDSAIAQDYPHLEIMVYDNCPTEEIRAICVAYPQVLYWRNTNTGYENIVDIAKASKGRYIKYLFDDDLLEPSCVSQMVNAIKQDKNARMAFSHSWIINDAGEKTHHRNKIKPVDKTSLIDGNLLCKKIAGNCINFIGEFSSVLFDGEWVRSTPESLSVGEKTGTILHSIRDVISYINAAVNRSVAFVDDTLTSFRVNVESSSNPDCDPNFIEAIRCWKLVIEEGKALGLLDADEVLRAKIKYNRLSLECKYSYPLLAELIVSSMYSPDIFDGYNDYHRYEQLIADGKESDAFALFQRNANNLYYWKIFQLMARIADRINDRDSALNYYFIASQNSWVPIDDSLRYAQLLVENNEFNAAKSILLFFLREYPDSVEAKELVAIISY